MLHWLDRYFEIEARGSTPRREMLAGATTWLTLAYIVLVNPIVLGAAGMDSGAVMVATCLGAALATASAGVFARLPVALAPGMGLNFLFAFTLCGAAAAGGFGLSWQQALAATFIAGALFLASALFKVRSKLMDMVPEPLRHGIVAGIGLMIAVIGLRWAGLLVATPSTYIGPGDIGARPVQVALVGLAVAAILVIRRVPGVGDGSRFAVGGHPLLRTGLLLIGVETASGNHGFAGRRAHEVDEARDWGSGQDA